MDNSEIYNRIDGLKAKGGKNNLLGSVTLKDLINSFSKINYDIKLPNKVFINDLSSNFHIYRCKDIRQIMKQSIDHYLNVKRYNLARKCISRLEEIADWDGDDLLAPDYSTFNKWDEFIDYLESVKQSTV